MTHCFWWEFPYGKLCKQKGVDNMMNPSYINEILEFNYYVSTGALDFIY